MSLILTINPGSTSTKIAVYQDRKEVFEKTLRHSAEVIAQYDNIIDQYEFRKNTIVEALTENNIALSQLSAIVGRGGLLRPIPSGIYEVNSSMIEDLKSAKYGEHASNIGGILANELAKESEGCRAFIADPVVVDEMSEVAKIAGHPMFKRVSIFHALNQKAIAKTFAEDQGVPYDSLNLVVVHLGGGISVGAHEKGKVVDVNNALNGEGPFSPERSGTIPALQLAEACFSGDYTFDEIKKVITGKGGCVAHLGTNDFFTIENKYKEGDPKFVLISDAFGYNVAKEVGAMATVLSGKVDAIILTGGIARAKYLMEQIKERVEYIAPVHIYPGEDEMGALARNGFDVLDGKEEAKIY